MIFRVSLEKKQVFVLTERWCNLQYSVFQYSNRSGSGFMALYFRDTEWWQSHHHLALCHSSLKATDSVWLTRHTKQTYACVMYRLQHCVCRSVLPCHIDLPVHVAVFVPLISTVCVCEWVVLGGCVGVLMWWCSDVQCECRSHVVSAIASVTLTGSLSTQELLSHADCFCQSWAEAVTPQRFTTWHVWAAQVHVVSL